jgi:uncharacterized membrane protein YbhN (UPF0104 family)
VVFLKDGGASAEAKRAVRMHSLLRLRHLVLATVSTGLLALAVADPDLLGRRLTDALHGLAAAEPIWLWVAGAAFVTMHLTGGLAWRAALSACGTHTRPSDAVARYSVGSGLNAVAPAHIGSAVRVVLFARVVEGEAGIWRAGGAGAAVGAVRAVWLAAVVATAGFAGAIPLWPLAALAGVVALAAVAALCSRRMRSERRVAHVLDAFRELGRRPRSLVAVATLTGAGMTTKLLAAASVAASLGVERPFLAALVLVPAVSLAAVMPVTPGNVGVASAAVALALGAMGIGADTALATGIAFGAVETLAAVAIGAAGCLRLSGAVLPLRVRWAAASTSACVVASTCALTIV